MFPNVAAIAWFCLAILMAVLGWYTWPVRNSANEEMAAGKTGPLRKLLGHMFPKETLEFLGITLGFLLIIIFLILVLGFSDILFDYFRVAE